MAWAWTPVALVGAIGGLLACVLAGIIYLAHPRNAQNRFLALYFLMVGIWYLWGNGVRYLLAGPEVVPVVHAMGLAAIFFLFPLMQWAYTLFLSTVGGPVGRFLARRDVRIVLGTVFVAVALTVLIRPAWYVIGLDPWTYMSGWQYDVGPAADTMFRVQPLIHVLGIVVALTALREAKSPGRRRQLKIYAVAFITVDVSTAGWWTYLSLVINRPPFTAAQEQLYVIWSALNIFLLIGLVGYGILKAQLFDVDLRIKRGVRRSVVVAPFAVVFFVLSETLEGVLPFPGYWAGLVGAGVISLALTPIQRGASRLVDRLFPRVVDTDDYLQGRKEEIYFAALEAAVKDGVITHRERGILDGLRESLQLGAGTARRLEARAHDLL